MAVYEELPFYGPMQEVDPASDDLVPPALAQEVRSWKPYDCDVDPQGNIISSKRLEWACQNLFKVERFYVNLQ